MALLIGTVAPLMSVEPCAPCVWPRGLLLEWYIADDFGPDVVWTRVGVNLAVIVSAGLLMWIAFRPLNVRQRLGHSLAWVSSAAAMTVLNVFDFSREIRIMDAVVPFGVPFTWYRSDGFAGGGGMDWVGVALNVFAVMGLGLVLTLSVGPGGARAFPATPGRPEVPPGVASQWNGGVSLIDNSTPRVSPPTE